MTAIKNPFQRSYTTTKGESYLLCLLLITVGALTYPANSSPRASPSTSWEIRLSYKARLGETNHDEKQQGHQHNKHQQVYPVTANRSKLAVDGTAGLGDRSSGAICGWVGSPSGGCLQYRIHRIALSGTTTGPTAAVPGEQQLPLLQAIPHDLQALLCQVTPSQTRSVVAYVPC